MDSHIIEGLLDDAIESMACLECNHRFHVEWNVQTRVNASSKSEAFDEIFQRLYQPFFQLAWR